MSRSTAAPKNVTPQKTANSPSFWSSKQTLQEFQTYSGVYFSIFLCLHLLSTASASFGSEIYDELLATFRLIYHNPIVEISFILALFVHLVTGFVLHWKRDKFGLAPSPPSPWYLHAVRWTGAGVGSIILIHLGSGRLSSLLGKNRLDDFGHMHVLFNMAFEFSTLFFGTLITLGTAHLWFGFAQVLERTHLRPVGSYRTTVSHWLFWLSLGCALSGVWAGFLGFYSNLPSRESFNYWYPILNATVPEFLKSPIFSVLR
jgi:succinate dehydrogenase/fumarate reductase cytochrome b subunit